MNNFGGGEEEGIKHILVRTSHHTHKYTHTTVHKMPESLDWSGSTLTWLAWTPPAAPGLCGKPSSWLQTAKPCSSSMTLPHPPTILWLSRQAVLLLMLVAGTSTGMKVVMYLWGCQCNWLLASINWHLYSLKILKGHYVLGILNCYPKIQDN